MGVHERKLRERNQRIENIIRAASEIFTVKGFENATMEEIAEESELSKGTLYFYFKSKTELCLAILEKNLKQLSGKLIKSINDEPSGAEQFRETVMNIYEYFAENPHFYNAVNNFQKHKKSCKAENSTLLHTIDKNNKINSLLSEILTRGIEDGSIIDSVEPEKTAFLLWGQINGILPSMILADKDNESSLFSKGEIYRSIIKLLASSLIKR